MPDAPRDRTARVDVLVEGSRGPATTSSCTLIRDGDAIIVVDPGLAPSQAAIIDPLRALGVVATDVTDVVISHHHPDHTLNVALFTSARVHDHWAVYDFRGRWDDVDAEGRVLAPSVHLIRTPGHSDQDIATVIGTPEDVVVCTHLWWTEAGPADDPFCADPAVLRASRQRVLAIADVVIPGHGPAFRPTATTPR